MPKKNHFSPTKQQMLQRLSIAFVMPVLVAEFSKIITKCRPATSLLLFISLEDEQMVDQKTRLAVDREYESAAFTRRFYPRFIDLFYGQCG